MAEKHTVAMFVQGDDGRRVQVGWASPKDASGVRTFEYSPGFEGTSPKDVSFEDDELTQLVAEEQHEAREGDGSDGDEFEIAVEPAREDTPFGEVPAGETPAPVVEGQAVTDAQNAEPVVDAPDASEAAEPIEDAPDPELADDPTDASVELDNGGHIVDPNEDEEAEFQRLLAEEEAQEQPQTRRELRETEDNS